MKIRRLTFNVKNENTYILYDETGECMIIDCGCFTSQEQYILAQYIESHNLRPRRIVNTHLHLDHICGNGFVHRRYGIRPEAHKADEYLLEIVHYQSLALGIDEEGMEMTDVDCHFTGGETITFGNQELVVINTPGHSPGGISLYCAKHKALFTGDTLFREDMGMYRLPGGDQQQLVNSIKQTLFSLPPDTVVYPGHGEITTIAHEIANNQQVNKPIEPVRPRRSLRNH